MAEGRSGMGRRSISRRGAIVAAILALAVTLGACSSGSGATGAPESTAGATQAGTGQSSLTVQPMTVHYAAAEFATHYVVTAIDSAGLAITYAWTLQPPQNDPTCNNNGTLTGSTSEFVWKHNEQAGCDIAKIGALGHQGTVAITVSDGTWTCQAQYAGTAGPNLSPDTTVPFDACTRAGS